MRIPGLRRYQGRNPNGYFQDLDWPTRQRAFYWLLCKRWGRNLPPWRFAILVGRAKWLALNPPTSAWGRSMLAKRGGKAVQWKYRHEGSQPTEIATQVHRANARTRKEAAERKRLGLPTPIPSRVYRRKRARAEPTHARIRRATRSARRYLCGLYPSG